jgi:hypothetical protein
MKDKKIKCESCKKEINLKNAIIIFSVYFVGGAMASYPGIKCLYLWFKVLWR